MTVFPNKATFFAEGVESCFELDEQHDCPICMEQLDETSPELNLSANVCKSYSYTSVMSVPRGQCSVVVNVTTTISEADLQAEQHDDHTPIKMICCCNNIFGRHCLEVWLNDRNSCPTCRAELFPMNATMHMLNRVQKAFTTAVLSTHRRYMDEVVHQDISEHDEDESLRLELEEVCRPLRSDLEHLRRLHPDVFLPDAEDLNQTEDERLRRVEVEDQFEGMSNLFQPEDARSSGPEVEDLFEDIWTD